MWLLQPFWFQGIQYLSFCLPHQVRQGKQDFNKVGEVDVYPCECVCVRFKEREREHCLHNNELYSNNPVLV